jgi:uncharacterized protein (TIGR03000 family)
MSCYSSPYGMIYGSSVIPGTAGTPPTGKGAEPLPKPKKDEDETSNRGRLVVELPTDARLFIDGKQMKTQSGRREFQTPRLARGQTYYYILRAEVTRNERVQQETVRVLIRPGQRSYATFPTLAPAPEFQTTASR